MVAGSQSFSLLAIPLFMLAGELMTAGGLSQRLVDVAGVLVRHRTGGLAMAVILAALVFSAISGSAPATTAAIGAIMIPAMAARRLRQGLCRPRSRSARACLGPLIPPSIAFVIWGVIAEQSIGKLFLSGIVPGLAIAAGLLVVCYRPAPSATMCPREAARHLARDVKAAFARANGRLLSPVVVLGGIYGGVFTPTEAAGVSCVYATPGRPVSSSGS